MRLFVGIRLPREYGEGLREIRQKWEPRFASRLNWTRPENWHLTLKFIGEQDPGNVEAIRRAMDSVRFSPFYLQAGGGGYFSARGKIKVAWVGMSGDVDDLRSIVSDVDGEFSRIGIPAEKRAFKPHLTLFRVKYFEKEDPWTEFRDYLQDREWPGFDCREIILWQSTLTRSGPVYEQVHLVAGGPSNRIRGS